MGGINALLDAARAETGLDDFGDDSFREGLEILERSLREEAHLTPLGERFVTSRMILHLKQRLQVEDWYRRHPEIEDVQITAPLVGISLPRTGSTVLSFLLAEDPRTRYLTTWESSQPCPPPSTVQGDDPRISEVDKANKQSMLGGDKGHLPKSTVHSPMECQELMALDFKSFIFQAFAQVRSYSEWLMRTDFTSTYLYERRVLKLLQWGFPAKRWQLKCPNHLSNLFAFVTAFPDARFVMTHRDPTEVVVSNAHLLADYVGRFTEQLDPHYLGEIVVKQNVWSIQRAQAFRDAGNNDRIFDIHFRAMQRDPVGEVRKLYDWLGESVTPEFEANMLRWWQENAANREPNVHPEPSTFGIDLDAVRPLFADYTARFAPRSN
jgi:hypothetical protein